MAKGHPTGKPSVGKMLGSGSGGRQGGNVKGSRSTPTSALTDPSEVGSADVVALRKNVAAQGAMQQKQLKKNKSAGISVGKLKK